MSSGLVLDAGALVAIDRADRTMLRLLRQASARGLALAVTAPVVAQVWRDGRLQARLAAFLRDGSLEHVAFAPGDARAAGRLAALSGHSDVVDIHVVMTANRRGYGIVTSDAADMKRVDAEVEIITL